MNDAELKAWAEARGEIDHLLFCGGVTGEDVKAAVRQLFLDVAAEGEALGLEIHGMERKAARAADAFASAADNVRRAREALCVFGLERSVRVEREATLAHYLDALLDILPSGAR